jgi:hypothetical protein
MPGVMYKGLVLRVPNLNYLDQSSQWHYDRLKEGRISVSTVKRAEYSANDAMKFAVMTFENAGFILEEGEVVPEFRNQILLRLTFKPGGGN